MIGKKTILLAGILCVMALMLAGCGGSDNSSETPKKKVEIKMPDGYEKFTQKKMGFSIGYPKDWKKEEDAAGVMVTSPVAEGDTFPESVGFFLEKGDTGMPLDKYYKLSIDNMKKAYPTYKEEENKDVDINGVKAKRIVATYAAKGLNFKSILYVLVSGNKGVAIVCTAMPDTYDQFEKDFDTIANTLSID